MAARKSTAERIADDIVFQIESGALKPGSHLREQELAERYQTSRGPVREALHILGSKFWVKLEPGRGARVVEHDMDVHPDASMVGGVLQSLAARLAAVRATPEEIAGIERAAQSVAEAAMGEIAPTAFLEKTWQLGQIVRAAAHSAIVEKAQEAFASGGGLMHAALDGLQLRSQRLEAARLWVDVAVAIRMRDAAAAEAISRKIVMRSLRASMRSAIHSEIWRGFGNETD
ncbi:MAG: GntR family transcriptional regulator [Proteobacteria bacterium]|nr:GntR family transcriptional regulator [Pseudomonadota bacterium]